MIDSTINNIGYNSMRIYAPTTWESDFEMAFRRLAPQLSETASVINEDEFDKLIASGSHVIVARDEHHGILGAAAVIAVNSIFGRRCRIEDVIVDISSRGNGIGANMIMYAIELAKSMQSKHIDLTSSPSREIANRLYRSIGFELRDTNIYRLELEKEDVSKND